MSDSKSNPFCDNPAPPYRLRYNVSPLIDIPNASIMKGDNGETYFCGGMQSFGGITAKGNTFKSTLGQFISKRIGTRYDGTVMIDYDTEETIDLPRVNSLAKRHCGVELYTLMDEGKYILTNKASYSGNKFYDLLKTWGEQRTKDKGLLRTVPFRDRNDKPKLKITAPIVAFMDSISQFSTDSVETIQDESEIGESKRNTESLRENHAKDQMIRELPHITLQNNFIVLSVAHMGDKHSLNPMEPPSKQFAHLKQGLKLKNVPEKYTFLTNNLWGAVTASALNNKSTRASEYPRSNDPENPNDTDMTLANYFDLRSKGGSSGIPIPFVFSQREGVLEGVSMWHLLKENKQHGLISGHNSYAMILYPTVFAGRKQVRDILDADYKFVRALELTASDKLLEIFHPETYYSEAMPLKDVYEKIKELGYDWDRLLSETRSYWVWEESDKKHLYKYLSIIDLYNMAKGLYHPTWYGKKPIVNLTSDTVDDMVNKLKDPK